MGIKTDFREAMVGGSIRFWSPPKLEGNALERLLTTLPITKHDMSTLVGTWVRMMLQGHARKRRWQEEERGYKEAGRWRRGATHSTKA